MHILELPEINNKFQELPAHFRQFYKNKSTAVLLQAVLGCVWIAKFLKACFPGGLGTHEARYPLSRCRRSSISVRSASARTTRPVTADGIGTPEPNPRRLVNWCFSNRTWLSLYFSELVMWASSWGRGLGFHWSGHVGVNAAVAFRRIAQPRLHMGILLQIHHL